VDGGVSHGSRIKPNPTLIRVYCIFIMCVRWVSLVRCVNLFSVDNLVFLGRNWLCCISFFRLSGRNLCLFRLCRLHGIVSFCIVFDGCKYFYRPSQQCLS
jgi:hypothetical protein